MTRIQRVAPVYNINQYRNKKKQVKGVKKNLSRPPDNAS